MTSPSPQPPAAPQPTPATPPRVAALRDKPHAPARTLMRRLLGPLYVTGTLWYRLAWWSTWYPNWFVATMVWSWTTFFWLVLWRIRRAVASNLEAAIGPCGFWERQRRIWRVFHDYAWCYAERYEQFRPGRRFRFDFAGERTFEVMQGTARGFVFFTAHFGNWEMGPLVDELPRGRKFHVVREPEMSDAAQRFIQGLFERHPMREQFVVHYAGADLALGARLLMALRKGDVVGMPGDRPRAGMETIQAEMFGRAIDLPPGPVALARAANALMVPVFVFREGRRHYRIELWDTIEVGQGSDKPADIRAGVAAMAAACERAIRQRPSHWFCWKELWPRTPAATDQRPVTPA